MKVILAIGLSASALCIMFCKLSGLFSNVRSQFTGEIVYKILLWSWGKTLVKNLGKETILLRQGAVMFCPVYDKNITNTFINRITSFLDLLHQFLHRKITFNSY